MFLFIVAPYDLIGHKRQFMLDLSLEMRSLGFTSSQLHGLSTGGLFPIIRHVCVTHVGRRAFKMQLSVRLESSSRGGVARLYPLILMLLPDLLKPD
jgi:hypothetical protein